MRTIVHLPKTASGPRPQSGDASAFAMTAEAMRSAARQMLRDCLSERDVSDTLRLDVNGVRRLVGECDDCE